MGPESSGSARLGVWPLILAHVLIALPLAYFLNIWADEASTLYTTQHGIAEAFRNAATNERQAPLYFWVLSLWRSVNDSIFFARLFSIICSVAAIKLFARLVARLFEPRPAFLATAFFALHPFLIWASLEIRVYSLVILLSVGLMCLFVEAFFDSSNDQEPTALLSKKVAFLLVCIVALYTNYYLGFVLAGLFVGLAVMKRSRAIRDYAVIMLVTGLAFAPISLSLLSQFAANAGGFQEERSLVEGVRLLWHKFLIFVLPAGILTGDSNPLVSTIRLWIIRVALAVVAIFALKDRNRLSRRSVAAGAGVATIFLGLLTAYLLLGPVYIALRHASVLFAPLIVLVTAVLIDLFGHSEKRGLIGRTATVGTGLIVLAFFAYSLTVLHPNLTKRGDWARVGSFIEQNETAGQPIVVFPVFGALALPYHYRGTNKILPSERFFAFSTQATFGTPESLASENEYVISVIPRDAETLWLALGEKCLVSQACAPLENYVRANYTIEIEKDFYLERLYLLRKKQ